MDAFAVTPPSVAGPLRLEAFRAWRLAPAKVGEPSTSRTIARPSPRALDRLRSWEARGLLTADPAPALHLHEYTTEGITVRGLVGGLDISRGTSEAAERVVLPHEGIYPSRADDLADQMEHTGLDPAPIVLVQRSPAAVRRLLTEVRGEGPQHHFRDRAGRDHRLWTITDRRLRYEISRALAETTALIADGHHRYAAHLSLRDRPDGRPHRQALTMLVDQDDTPLFLGAIHRVLVGSSMDDVVRAAAATGLHVADVARDRALARLVPHVLVATDGHRWSTLRPRLPVERPEVELLHARLVPALNRAPRSVTTVHSVDAALHTVRRRHGVAVLLPSPSLDEVFRCVLADRLLPQKATSFQPKPALGALIRWVHDDAGPR